MKPVPWPRLERYPDAVMVENRRAIWQEIRNVIRIGYPGALLEVRVRPQPRPVPLYRRPRSTWTEEERQADAAKRREQRFRAKMRSRHWLAEKAALDADLEVWRIVPDGMPLRLLTKSEAKEHRRRQKEEERLWLESARLREIHERNAEEARQARRAAERERLRQKILDSYTPEERELDRLVRERLRKS